MNKIPVGLQLYTVRDWTEKDFVGTVRKVAEMGYAGVEFAGYGGLSAEAMGELLDETGLEPAGSHVAIPLMEEDLEGVIRYNQAIGNPFVGVPWMATELRNPAGFRQVAKKMNVWGQAYAEAGIQLYYHNHNFEFEMMDGVTGWEILMNETDPDLVYFETDVYWMRYAGYDPAELIKRYADRIALVHLKDMTGEGDARTFAEVGEGTTDFAPIFAAAEAADADWYIVEQDRCNGSSIESARMSLNNLKAWNKA